MCRLSLVVASRVYSPVAVCALPAVASLVLELSAWASVVAARGFSICGSWALEHRLRSCGAQA